MPSPCPIVDIPALGPQSPPDLVGEDESDDGGLVLCLDSGCATYDTLWLTTSLRGVVSVTVEVHVLSEGVNSGSAGGVVPAVHHGS